MSRKPAQKKSKQPLQQVSSHEDRVFQLGSKLLGALEDNRLLIPHENIKGIGWFLVCVGESLEKGSLVQARRLRSKSETMGSSLPSSTSLAVSFCYMGDQVMNWAAGLYHREKKNGSSSKAPRAS